MRAKCVLRSSSLFSREIVYSPLCASSDDNCVHLADKDSAPLLLGWQRGLVLRSLADQDSAYVRLFLSFPEIAEKVASAIFASFA